VKDKRYHIIYLKRLIEEIFHLKAVEIKILQNNERFLDVYSINLVKFFRSIGINPGNKIKNQSTIPAWVWEDKVFMRACLRGLVDTDGSIFRMSKKDPNLLRISFTNYNNALIEDTRKAFIKLGFHPSKIILNKQFFLSRKEDINKYLKEIGFSNKKHNNRINLIKSLVM
jgi:intein/homing endonuclease